MKFKLKNTHETKLLKCAHSVKKFSVIGYYELAHGKVLLTLQVTGVMTQGRADGAEWVTSYLVSYSLDGLNWLYVTDPYGNQRVTSKISLLEKSVWPEKIHLFNTKMYL